ncbi:unnamed protein product, partial [Pleuronectes platessa]
MGLGQQRTRVRFQPAALRRSFSCLESLRFQSSRSLWAIRVDCSPNREHRAWELVSAGPTPSTRCCKARLLLLADVESGRGNKKNEIFEMVFEFTQCDPALSCFSSSPSTVPSLLLNAFFFTCLLLHLYLPSPFPLPHP